MEHRNVLLAFAEFNNGFFRASRHTDPNKNSVIFLGLMKADGAAESGDMAAWHKAAFDVLDAATGAESVPDAGHGGDVDIGTMRSNPWYSVFVVVNADTGVDEIWAARFPKDLGSDPNAGRGALYYIADDDRTHGTTDDGFPLIAATPSPRSVIFEDIGAIPEGRSEAKEQGCAEADGAPRKQRRAW